jgi:hypothetical protein
MFDDEYLGEAARANAAMTLIIFSSNYTID